MLSYNLKSPSTLFPPNPTRQPLPTTDLDNPKSIIPPALSLVHSESLILAALPFPMRHPALRLPRFLHIPTLLAFLGPLLYSPLLKEYVAGVENRGARALARPLFAHERAHLTRGDSFSAGEKLAQFHCERSLAGLWGPLEVGSDFLADVVAGVEDGNFAFFFALEMDIVQVRRGCWLFGGRCILLFLSALGLGSRFLSIRGVGALGSFLLRTSI